jgi:rsbT antagonist protein RsbS
VGGARIPIINLYANLIVPVQGALGDDVMAQLQDDVTRRIEEGGAEGLVIDVSGVQLMDSFMTRNIRDLALTARLMGVNTVVSGLGPAVAITLVEMGLEIPGIETTLNLERAIEVLAHRRKKEQGATLRGAPAPREALALHETSARREPPALRAAPAQRAAPAVRLAPTLGEDPDARG